MLEDVNPVAGRIKREFKEIVAVAGDFVSDRYARVALSVNSKRLWRMKEEQQRIKIAGRIKREFKEIVAASSPGVCADVHRSH